MIVLHNDPFSLLSAIPFLASQDRFLWLIAPLLSPQVSSGKGLLVGASAHTSSTKPPQNEKSFVLLRVIICKVPLNLAVSKSGSGWPPGCYQAAFR